MNANGPSFRGFDQQLTETVDTETMAMGGKSIELSNIWPSTSGF